MNQMIGEIKLIPYDDVPEGWLRCSGQSLHKNKYPKLYMLIGTKFGKEGEFKFRLPDLTETAPEYLTYCIAMEGELKFTVTNISKGTLAVIIGSGSNINHKIKFRRLIL